MKSIRGLGDMDNSTPKQFEQKRPCDYCLLNPCECDDVMICPECDGVGLFDDSTQCQVCEGTGEIDQ